MSRRLPARIAFALSLLVASVASAETTTPVPAQSAVAPTATPSLAGFDLLAGVGYGARTTKALGVELEPYSATFGVGFGYTFVNGLRLAANVDYGLGRSVQQQHQPLVGSAFELTAKASSLHADVSLAYDLWLHFLILRYALSLGLTWMNWDLGELPPGSVLRFAGAETQGSKFGFHFAPGLAVLWPFGRFECGLGFDYFVQFETEIPSGFLGKLLFGVKL
jgi:hypothetical protein